MLLTALLAALAAGCTSPEGGDGASAAPDARLAVAVAARPLTDGAVSLGERTYAVCATCHQPHGQGVPSAFPPLAGSEWVTGPAEVPIRIVLHGLHGPITVKNEPYVGTMAPLGDLLDDARIAAVLTYVRASWGNSAPPVTPAQVAAIRAATAARRALYRAEELEPMLK